MTKLCCVLRNIFLLFVFSAIVGITWSQTPEERKPDQAKPSSDVQSPEFSFSLIEQDLQEAMKAVPRGNISVAFEKLVPRGNYLAELGKLAKSYELKAKSGDRQAQFKIGALYLEGLGVRTNYGQAAFWFGTAGGAAHPLAQYAHGMFHQRTTQGSSDSHVRRAVFEAIGSIGPRAEPAIPVLEREIRDDLRDGRGAAIALGRIGERGVATLLKGLASQDVGRRRVAAEGLSEAGEAARIAVPELTAALKDEDEKTRHHAERALLRLGVKGFKRNSTPEAAPAVVSNVPDLVLGLKSPDEDRRKSSAAALAKLEGHGLPAMTALIAALKDDVPAVRAASAEALRNLREDARPAVAALIRALNDDEATVRANAAQALGWIGPGTEDAVPHLIKAMGDPDNRVRSNAARAFLTKWADGERAIPSLLKALDDADPSFGVPINAGYALNEFAKQGRSQIVVEGLVEYLKHPGSTGELIAIKTLKDIGSDAKAALPALEERSKSDNDKVRGAAIAAISNIGGPVDHRIPALIAGLRNDDWQIQETAARSIRDIGPGASAAVPELISLLDDQDRQAFERFKQAAEKGLAEAQFALAIQYRNGKVTPQDLASCLSWLQKAADQGHSEAQRHLGILYRQGRGVIRDDRQAEMWYRKSVTRDGALAKLRHPPMNDEAYAAALNLHQSKKSHRGNKELMLALTTFNDDATSAYHHQIHDEGTVDAFLEIYNHSTRGGGGYQLTPPEMARLELLLKVLPDGVEFVPLQQRMIFSYQVGDQWTTRTLDNQRLSLDTRLLLDLIRAPAPDDPFPPQERMSWLVKSDPPVGLIYLPDGTLRSWGTERRLFHWKNGNLLVEEDAGLESLHGRPIAASSGRVVTDEAQVMKLRDAKSGKEVAELGQSGLAIFSADEQTLVTCSYQQHLVRVWDTAAGRLRGEVQPGEFIRVIAVSADGLQLALYSDDKAIRIWDLETFKVKQELADSRTSNLTFFPDGKSFAGNIEGKLTIRELSTGEKRFQVPAANWTQMIRITPDGKTKVCVQGRRTIKRWDVRDGRVLGVSAGHTADITAIAISPDSQEIASASADGVIKLWNIERMSGKD